ncbi:histidine phosphatase superfamily [Chaetomidium leptoderma]|uniref:Histidine phosphatase superfamily n=1 Tax=Chaetomidium leptoderma TaxID=669021 RepID=A0AAN6VCY2_9PEZI|nr:histidine phosphatase superfamily [Chaetomidium leptoderma]
MQCRDGCKFSPLKLRLFLVRHGETVDNVAGRYAGITDSPLTSHGIVQAQRLAAHLVGRAPDIGPIRHVFSSDLTRAVETAAAVVDAQATISATTSQTKLDGRPHADADGTPLKLVQVPELRERDFGSLEGSKYGGGSMFLANDVETPARMTERAKKFVDGHLAPLLTAEQIAVGGSIVVVAHGVILDSLLRLLLNRYGSGEKAARLGDVKNTGWKNTGHVELIVGDDSASPAVADGPGDGAAEVCGKSTPTPPPQRQRQTKQPQITLTVVAVNVLTHLEGLTKTLGGIGSAQFDKRQRTMDSFFGPAAKKARVEKKPEEA